MAFLAKLTENFLWLLLCDANSITTEPTNGKINVFYYYNAIANSLLTIVVRVLLLL